ncbi:MAG: tRNA (adenosine(37)-N6)-threonylcarbamoyltransferase complex dimerization subunit type 1 TsaB [Candidatus Bipolaricaulota bacterium]
MWALGIESAGERGGVALLGEDGRGYELTFDAGRVHAEALGTATDSLAQAVGIDRRDLGLVAVDVGPGSFTGIRIGMAFAAGIAQALKLPTVGVRQSEGLGLLAAKEWPGRVVVWIHDRGHHMYTAWVSGEKVGQESASTLERALARLSGRAQVLVVGSGARRFREELAPLAPNVIAGLGYTYVPPLEVARRGVEMWKGGAVVPAGELEPRYVHPPVRQGKEL